jgi:hypothetical protein
METRDLSERGGGSLVMVCPLKFERSIVVSMSSANARIEAFRECLETSGLADSISRVMAALYDAFDRGQHPPDPMEFVKESLGAPEGFNADDLRRKNDALRQRIDELKAQLRP